MKKTCQMIQVKFIRTSQITLRSISSIVTSSGPTVATNHTARMSIQSSRPSSLKPGKMKPTTPTRRSVKKLLTLRKLFLNILFRSRATYALSSKRRHTWLKATRRILSSTRSKLPVGILSGISTKNTSWLLRAPVKKIRSSLNKLRRSKRTFKLLQSNKPHSHSRSTPSSTPLNES